MKIVCDACSAKYSIADEKVRGKVFKIRCKKCSNIIVVRGTDEQPQDQYSQQADARTYDYDSAPGDDAVWHLVINQEQVGPMTESEVRERFARGEVELDTYTWREGFSDWSPLGTVEPFTDLQNATQAAGMYAGGAAEDGATVQSDPADLFAAAASGAAPSDDAAADLFGGNRSAGASEGVFGGDGAAAAGDDPSAQLSAEAERKLRGERNENSVLFSLNNLAALASETPKPASAAKSGASAPRAGGVANTGGSEGSGLIDIRSMAQIYHGDRGQSASAGSGSDDDLPVFGQSSFAAPAPVLLPTPVANTNNKPLYIMLGVIGVLVVAAAVLVILVVKGGGRDTVAVVDPAAGIAPLAAQTPGDTTQTGDTAAKSVEGDKAGNPDEGKSGDGAQGASAKEKGDDKEDGSAAKATSKTTRTASSGSSTKRSGSSSGSSSSSSSSGSSSSGSSSSGSSSGSSSSSSGGGCLDEVGCLLADKPPACCSKYSGGGGGKKSSGGGGSSSGSGGGNLPEQPSRAEISSAMSGVGGRVTSCGSRHPAKGEVKVTVKVAPSGSVGDVSVRSSPDPALGKCVADTVKGAKFPKTEKGITFTYPYRF
jgi:TonB family protein